MTEEQLRQIEERANKATASPWGVRKRNSEDMGFVQAPRYQPSDPYDIEVLGDDDTLYPTKAHDIEFIAHARHDIPSLIADVRRLWAMATKAGY